VFLRGSEPSFDSALGVSGGVFFERDEDTPSVSLASSRCEFKEESAETGGRSVVGVLDSVDEEDVAGLEI